MKTKNILEIVGKSLNSAKENIETLQKEVEELKSLSDIIPNDQELGKEVRKFFQEKFSSTEFQTCAKYHLEDGQL